MTMAMTIDPVDPVAQRDDRATWWTGPRQWRRLLAVAVVAQPLLLAVNGAFHPDVDLDAASMLAGAAESASAWYRVHLVAAIGGLLGAPAALGLRSLLRARSRTGDAGVALALVAAVVLPLSFAAEASVLRLAATADLGEPASLALADAYVDSPEFLAIGVGVLAATLATVLLGAALLRERRVPGWMPMAMVAGTLLATVSPPGSVLAPAAFGIVAVAAAGLARRVATGPARRRRPVTTAGGA